MRLPWNEALIVTNRRYGNLSKKISQYLRVDIEVEWQVYYLVLMHPSQRKPRKRAAWELRPQVCHALLALNLLDEKFARHFINTVEINTIETPTNSAPSDTNTSAPLAWRHANVELASISNQKYLHAFSKIILSPHQKKMLRANYLAPQAKLSAQQMAKQLDYKRFSAVNLHYGTLGHQVAEALGLHLECGVNSLVVIQEMKDGSVAWILRPQVCHVLEQLGIVDETEQLSLDETEALLFREGKSYKASINRYERSRSARQRCIEHYGTRCYICNFSFGDVYGEQFAHFVHVHHLEEMASIAQEYTVDPIKDLRPVCPNCHAILHQRKPAYTIEDVHAMLRK